MESLYRFLKIFREITIIAIPIIVIWIGSSINKSISEKEIRQEYIKIAVDILRDKPSEETTEIRFWAIEILNEYSEIKLNEESIEQLKRNSIMANILVNAMGRAYVNEKGEYYIDKE